MLPGGTGKRMEEEEQDQEVNTGVILAKALGARTAAGPHSGMLRLSHVRINRHNLRQGGWAFIPLGLKTTVVGNTTTGKSNKGFPTNSEAKWFAYWVSFDYL